MRIENNYYGEDLEEYGECDDASQPTEAPAPRSDDFIRWFMSSLADSRTAARAEKRAAGLCLPVSEYDRFCELADNLAERIGLDFAADSGSGVGFLSLTGPKLELHSSEEPELIDALTQVIARADRLYLETVQKYGQTLISLALYYDLYA